MNLLLLSIHGFLINSTEIRKKEIEYVVIFIFFSVNLLFLFYIFEIIFRRGPKELKSLFFKVYLRFKVLRFLKKCFKTSIK